MQIISILVILSICLLGSLITNIIFYKKIENLREENIKFSKEKEKEIKEKEKIIKEKEEKDLIEIEVGTELFIQTMV